MGSIEIERVVIDTNVVVSALLFGGTPGELIPLWKSGSVKAFASMEIIDEYLRVLTYPRFNLSENEIDYLLYQEILPFFEVASSKRGPTIVKEDPSDDKFIHCAQASQARTIISGDRHLLMLEKFSNIKIVSPSQYLKERYGITHN